MKSEVILEAITAAGYKPGEHIAIALDPASSEFYEGKPSGKYVFKKSDKSAPTPEQMTAFWADWVSRVSTVWIEDGLAKDGLGRMEAHDHRARGKVQLVGDDLFATNTERPLRGISEKIANAILIKLNQIGSVTETIDAIDMARKAGYAPIAFAPSTGNRRRIHRRTLAVAMGTGQIKTGSASRTDPVAKYNQLLRIEEDLALPQSSGTGCARAEGTQ